MEKTEMKNKNRRKKKNNFFKSFILILVLVIAGTLFFGIQYYKSSLKAMAMDEPINVEIVIPSASSSAKIANILYENGLIKNELIFRYYAKTQGQDNKLKAGEYTLSTGMNIDEILENLVKGVKGTNTARFTIPEGYELVQVVDKLAKEGLVDRDKFNSLVSDKANFEEEFTFLKQLNDGQTLEGYLFPSTYEIYIGASEEDIISKMLSEFEKIYISDIEPKMKEMNMTLNEIVTFASIVEREGKLDSERPLMSAVFHNRINIDMALQSCATVQYILGERKEVLTNAETQIPSPYNTYINKGLPPAPIASPGKASIVATMEPADVDYLFFVLTGDDGSHTFTKTYNAHLNAKPKK